MHERRGSDLVVIRTTNEDIRIAGYNQTDYEYTTHVEDRDANKSCPGDKYALETWLHETHCGERLVTSQ